jgi:hypothetical protein
VLFYDWFVLDVIPPRRREISGCVELIFWRQCGREQLTVYLIEGEIMLGENVGSVTGATTMKALPAVDGAPSFETAASGLSGIIAGTDVTVFSTYAATMRADGSFYGECPNAGVVMAGDGVATFRATGTGSPTAEGGFSFRGVAYFETAAPSLSSLNNVAMAYEWDVDATGEATWGLWEWK